MTRGEFQSYLALNRHKLGKPMPRPVLPDAQVRRYKRALRGMLEPLLADALAKLEPAVRGALVNPSRLATDAAKRPSIAAEMDQIEVSFWAQWPRKKIRGMVTPVAREVNKMQAAGLNRQLASVVSVDVVGSEPWLGKAIEDFTAENVALIKSIPQQFLDQVETVVTREVADGARWEDISDSIAERFKVSESRADLIARDQVGKFYGDLNRVRQTDLGIDSFAWRTSGDNRVREEHEERNGQVYKWSSPPEGETPGEPVLCRCYADPILNPDQ